MMQALINENQFNALHSFSGDLINFIYDYY